MKGKTVTILGASGFLGRYIVKHLAERGATIRACCRNTEEAKALKTLGEVGQISLISVDIQHQKRLESVCRDADYVVNCVGVMDVRNPKKMDLIHHLALKKLAEICWIVGVDKLIHISALGIDENSESIYGQTKYKGEQALLKHFNAATILKPSVIFGPEDNFLNRFAAMTKLSPFLPLIGGGTNLMQPVFVNDVAHAVIKCLEKEETKGKIYQLAGPKIYSFKELMQFILDKINRKRYLISIPRWLMLFNAFFLKWLPGIPITPDQVRMTKANSIADKNAPGLKELGITPTPLELIAPTYLSRYSKASRLIPEPGKNRTWRHP